MRAENSKDALKRTPGERVRVEFQFRRGLGSEISRCNVFARHMTQV